MILKSVNNFYQTDGGVRLVNDKGEELILAHLIKNIFLENILYILLWSIKFKFEFKFCVNFVIISLWE